MHGNRDATLSNSTVYSMLATCDTTPGGQPKDCHDAASATQYINHGHRVPQMLQSGRKVFDSKAAKQHTLSW